MNKLKKLFILLIAAIILAGGSVTMMTASAAVSAPSKYSDLKERLSTVKSGKYGVGKYFTDNLKHVRAILPNQIMYMTTAIRQPPQKPALPDAANASDSVVMYFISSSVKVSALHTGMHANMSSVICRTSPK